MKVVITYSIFTGALALQVNDDTKSHLFQQSISQDGCPFNSVLVNGACRAASLSSSKADDQAITFTSNTTSSLTDSRTFAAQQRNFPWTFWPECYSVKNKDEAYCVFTDQEFASGRGIFIVTTESRAQNMRKRRAFTDPSALQRVNRHENPPFMQHEFPGKGRGLVANKTLHKGDQIFASTPLLISDSDTYALPENERLALLYRGVATLPPKSQEQFYELLGHFEDDPIDDRINTNNFEVYIDSIPQAVVLPEISMLNHDCRPNAAYFWDEDTLSHYVHALRDIAPGEEITISYTDNEKARDERVRRLKAGWGFTCDCSTCMAHPSLTAESDARLYQITDLQEILNDWSSESHATPEVAEMMVSLYEQERLYASLSLAYKHAAEAHSSFGNRWKAMKYARLSAEMNMLNRGFSDVDVADMQAMASKPEMSWSWKKRVGLRGRGCGCGGSHAH